MKTLKSFFLVLFSITTFLSGCASVQSIAESDSQISDVFISYNRFALANANEYDRFIFPWGAIDYLESVNPDVYSLIKTPHYEINAGIQSTSLDISNSSSEDSKSSGDRFYDYYSTANRSDNYSFLSGMLYNTLLPNRSSSEQEIIQSIVMYSMIKKAFKKKGLSGHFYDFIVASNDLDQMVESLGKPASIYDTTLVSSDGVHIGSLARLFYNDAYYYVAVGPDCSFSKILYYYRRGESLGNVRDHLIKIFNIKGANADSVDSSVNSFINQIMEFAKLLNSKDNHYASSNIPLPSWFNKKYSKVVTKADSIKNNTLSIVSSLERKDMIGKCMNINNWIDVNAKIKDAYDAASAERETAYANDMAASQARMASYNAMLGAVGGAGNLATASIRSASGGGNQSVKGSYGAILEALGAPAGSNGSVAAGGSASAQKAWYYDSRVGGGKSSPVGPYRSRAECEAAMKEHAQTMDYKITRQPYQK